MTYTSKRKFMRALLLCFQITDLFLTASTTFQRLGDLATLLNVQNTDYDERCVQSFYA